MEDFNYYKQNIIRRIERLETNLAKLEKSDNNQKLLNECDPEVKRLRSDFDACEQALLEVEDALQQGAARKELEDLRQTFNRIHAELEFKRGGQSLFGNQVPQPAEPQQPLSDMNVQQVISRGDKAYLEAEERMKNAYGVSEQAKQVAGGIEAELYEQEQQIDRVDEKAQDIRSLLKKAGKVMNLIYRRYLTDKLILCLICVIFIVIVFLIVYGALGLDEEDQFNTPDDQV